MAESLSVIAFSDGVTMHRIASRLSAARRIGPKLEIPETRLPVSQAMGMSLALAALCSVGAVLTLSGELENAARVQAIALNAATADTLMFHRGRARTGWNSSESILTPNTVSAHLGLVWSSPQLDSITLDGSVYLPHIYASPLYVDKVQITGGPYAGSNVGAVFTATSTGFVYAIKAFDTALVAKIAPGTILWHTSLGQPTPTIDGGVTVGVLGTPAIDLSTNRLYVAADVTDDSGRNWKVFGNRGRPEWLAADNQQRQPGADQSERPHHVRGSQPVVATRRAQSEPRW